MRTGMRPAFAVGALLACTAVTSLAREMPSMWNVASCLPAQERPIRLAISRASKALMGPFHTAAIVALGDERQDSASHFVDLLGAHFEGGVHLDLARDVVPSTSTVTPAARDRVARYVEQQVEPHLIVVSGLELNPSPAAITVLSHLIFPSDARVVAHGMPSVTLGKALVVVHVDMARLEASRVPLAPQSLDGRSSAARFLAWFHAACALMEHTRDANTCMDIANFLVKEDKTVVAFNATRSAGAAGSAAEPAWMRMRRENERCQGWAAHNTLPRRLQRWVRVTMEQESFVPTVVGIVVGFVTTLLLVTGACVYASRHPLLQPPAAASALRSDAQTRNPAPPGVDAMPAAGADKDTLVATAIAHAQARVRNGVEGEGAAAAAAMHACQGDVHVDEAAHQEQALDEEGNSGSECEDDGVFDDSDNTADAAGLTPTLLA